MFRDSMQIVRYQLSSMFAKQTSKELFDDLLPNVADRYMESYKKIKPLVKNKFTGHQNFDHSNDSKYAMFLWFLSNEIWFQYEDGLTANLVQALNKALHGCHLPYDALMPDIFYLPHTQGIVVARKVILKNYLCLYQGTTIGRVGDKYPTFEGPLIMYPYSSITGNAKVPRDYVMSNTTTFFMTQKEYAKIREDLFDFHFIGWKDE